MKTTAALYAPEAPALSEIHPLGRTYRRNLTRAAIVASIVHLVWFGAGMIYRHLNPDMEEKHTTIVHLVELGSRPEPPKPPPPAVKAPTHVAPPTLGPAKPATPRTMPRPQTVAQAKPAGTQGRARARAEVTEKLAETTKSVESAIGDLSSALASSQDGQPAPSRARGRRSVRSGRTGDAVGGVSTGAAGASSSADLSAMDGSLVAIERISAVSTPGGGADGVSDGTAGEGKSQRSTASLLAVVRKYAAGIQYCYENELKHQGGLQGKLVVSLTVAPSGQVTDVKVVDDTLHSQALRECALAQMKAWKFPPVSEGTISFRAPFVFTPPKQVDRAAG